LFYSSYNGIQAVCQGRKTPTSAHCLQGVIVCTLAVQTTTNTVVKAVEMFRPQ